MENTPIFIKDFHTGIFKRIVILFLCILGVSIVIISKQYLYCSSLLPVLKFISFTVIYVQLPGFIFVRLLGIRFQSKMTILPSAFFFGMAVILFEYFLCFKLGYGNATIWINPLLSIAGIAVLIKRGFHKSEITKALPRLKDLDIAFLVFIIILFLSSIILLRNLYSGSLYTEQFSIHKDLVWHMGLVNALSENLPPTDPHFSGLPIGYHYFTDLFYAISQKVTGVSSDIIILTCCPYLITFLFGTSTYAFFREFTKNRNFTGIYCLISLLPGVTLAGELLGVSPGYGISWFHYHVLTNINSVGISISTVMVFLILIRACINKVFLIPASWKTAFCISIMVILSTGMKGPVGMLEVGSIVICFIYTSVREKRLPKNLALIMISAVISFVLIYIFVLSAPSTSDSATNIRPLPFELSTQSISMSAVYSKYFSSMPDNYATIIFLIFINILLTYAFYSLPFFITIINRLKRQSKSTCDIAPPTLIMLSIVVVGVVIYYTNELTSTELLYFTNASYPIVALFTFQFFENKSLKKPIQNAILTLFLFGLCINIIKYTQISSFLFGNATFEYREEVPSPGHYSQQTNQIQMPFGLSLIPTQNNTLSHDEYDAMQWIKKNTPATAILAVNRKELMENGDIFFLYSAYSKRNIYLEGTAYSAISDKEEYERRKTVNDSLFRMNNEYRAIEAAQSGIDYIIVSKQINPDLNLSTIDFKRIFSNSDIDIYQVQ